MAEHWTDNAECRIAGHAFNRDFVEPIHREMRPHEQRKCKPTCDRCPVYEQCFEWTCESEIDPLPYMYAAGMTSKQRKLYRRGVPLDAIHPHGTHLRYITFGCRCVSCKAAKRRHDSGKRKQT